MDLDKICGRYFDPLRFIEYKDNVLEMNCYVFGNWSNNVTLFLDCETMIATK